MCRFLPLLCNNFDKMDRFFWSIIDDFSGGLKLHFHLSRIRMIHWLIVHYDRATIDNAQRNVLCTVFRVARFSSFSFFFYSCTFIRSISFSLSLFFLLSHSFGYQTTYERVLDDALLPLFSMCTINSQLHILSMCLYTQSMCVCVLYKHKFSLWCECCKSRRKKKYLHTIARYHDATALTYMFSVYADGLPSGSWVSFDPFHCTLYST